MECNEVKMRETQIARQLEALDKIRANPATYPDNDPIWTQAGMGSKHDGTALDSRKIDLLSEQMKIKAQSLSCTIKPTLQEPK